jgi:integrating conjugative element protein (TIGR03759 family)
VMLTRMIGMAFLLSASGVFAQSTQAPTYADSEIVYKPTSSTQELLTRYSRMHDTPNGYWQLTKDEWARYEELKATSPWSTWENNSSPLAVLSFYAESREEKRRYARIEAELDTWRQYSVTEFQTLYDKERAIVHQRYVEFVHNRQPTIASITAQDRLRLFIKAGACDAFCRSVMSRVLSTQAKTDIYVIGAANDREIFSWAEAAYVPVDRVKTQEITLNHAHSLLDVAAAEAGLPVPRLPVLFKKSGDTLQVVPL